MLLVLSCATLMSIGASGIQEKASSAEDETLVVAVQALPITAVHAMAEMSNVSERIFYSVEETLIKTDYLDDGKMKPALAESWKLLDEKSVEFTLREGVLFHNGEELTSEDVAFTFGSQILTGEDAPGKAVGGAFLSNIESVEAVDRYTVRITAKSPDALPSYQVRQQSDPDHQQKGIYGKCRVGRVLEDAGRYRALQDRRIHR